MTGVTASQPIKVFVPVTWETEEARIGATLVFSTLRVGFPTADVVVIANGCAPEYEDELGRIAASNGLRFYACKKASRGRLLKDIIDGQAIAGRTDPICVTDADMEYFSSMEDTPLRSLFVAPLQPTTPLKDGVMAPRPIPCIFFVSNPVEASAAVKEAQDRFFIDNLFEAAVGRDEFGLVLYDTCAQILSMLPSKYSVLPDEGKWRHMSAGTYPDRLTAVGLAPEVEAAIRARHDEMKGGLVRLNWAYVSGVLETTGDNLYYVSVSRFLLPDGKIRVHTVVTDSADNKPLTCISTEPGPLSATEIAVATGAGNLVLHCAWQASTDATTRRPGGGSSRHSFGPATVTGRLGNDTELHGEMWIETEDVSMRPGTPWTWVCARLYDGTSIMVYDIPGCEYAYFDMAPAQFSLALPDLKVNGREFKISPVGDIAFVTDKDFGIQYSETPCGVYEDGQRVGYAFVEIVPAGWSFASAPTNAESILNAKFNEWAMNIPEAAECVRILYRISQVADDLADGDAVNREESVAELLQLTLLRLPHNRFYRGNWSALSPFLASSLAYWAGSNVWARSANRDHRVLAYAHRESAMQSIWAIARIVGGDSHAFHVLNDMIGFFHREGAVESLADWERSIGG